MTTRIAFIFVMALSWAASPSAKELLIQFVNQEIVGDGGVDDVTFLSHDIETAFRQAEVSDIRAVFTQFATEKTIQGFTVRMPNFANYHVLTLPENKTESLTGFLQSRLEVSSVEINEIEFEASTVGTCSSPNDPAFVGDAGAPLQWYLRPDGDGPVAGINIEPAWQIVCSLDTIPEIKVALFDYQVHIGVHEEYSITNYREVDYQGGHGNTVFSIIGAFANNGIFMAGIGRNVAGIAYSVHDGPEGTIGPVSIDTLWEMIYHATDIWQADVISNSAGIVDAEAPNDAVHKILQYAYLSGIPIVVAGGNSHALPMPYPAGYGTEVIAVGGTRRSDGDWSGWSSIGPELNLAAPAVDIVVVDGFGNFDVIWGTSYAQPLVAGTIALMRAVNPSLTAEDYEGLLTGYAVDIGEPGFNIYTGWGRLDSGRSVANLIGPYGIDHGIAVGASSTVTLDRTGRVIGVQGISEQTTYYITQYKHTIEVTWGTAFVDSVWCWGSHLGSTGYRKMHRATVHNVPMSYRVDSNTMGGVFETYAYNIYSDSARQDLIYTLGDTNSSTVQIRYGVVGKRPVTLTKLENRSTETGLDYEGQPYSAVGFDYDNEGGGELADLFVTQYQEDTEVFLCLSINENGVPVFANRTEYAFGESPPSDMRGCSVADFDNDGHLDLFVAGGNANNAVLYRNVSGITGRRFEAVADSLWADPHASVLENVHAGVWADFDGDGLVDLYLCRGEGIGGSGSHADVLLRNLGGESGFENVTAASGIGTGAGNSIAAVWADVTGNGRSDLFVTEASSQTSAYGKLFIHSNEEIGSFTEQAAQRFGGNQPDYPQTAVDFADISGDGAVDLVIGFADGPHGAIVYVNNGYGSFSSEEPITFPSLDGASGVRILDLDLNGRPDLLATSANTTTPPIVYRNTAALQGGVQFINVSHHVFDQGSAARAEGLVTLDWDRDGYKDLFLGRPTASGEFYYRATEAEGWAANEQPVIVVRLASEHGLNNRAGIGARVEPLYQSRPVVQWVDGGSGRGGQNDLALTFPVDQPSGTVLVAVLWPNGFAQVDTVPVHTPGSAPHVILDQSTPEVINATVSGNAEYDPVTETMTLVFTWQSKYTFDSAKDKVTLISPPGHCGLPAEIKQSTQGSELTTERFLDTGNYLHTMRWSGWVCVPSCTFNYKVTSAIGDKSSTSGPKQLNLKFCPAQ